MSSDSLAAMAATLPDFGRLRVASGVMVWERTFYVRAASDLAGVLSGREECEDLLVQKFPSNWLVTFSKTFREADASS
jgi:uncharacterized protein with von Willebrand factor type A (vWA) domain